MREISKRKTCSVYSRLLKVHKALCRRNAVKAFRFKVKFFGRGSDIINIRSRGFGKQARIFDLVFGNIGAGPFCSVFFHAARQNTRARGKVKHSLPIGAAAELNYAFVKFGGVNISVFCIIFTCQSPVKLFAAVYIFTAYHIAVPPK